MASFVVSRITAAMHVRAASACVALTRAARVLPRSSTGFDISCHGLSQAMLICTSIPAMAPKKKGAASSPSSETEALEDEGDAEEVASINPKDLKAQMGKHVEYAKRELTKLRGATANPSESYCIFPIASLHTTGSQPQSRGTP